MYKRQVIGATIGMIGTEEFIENPVLQYYPLYAAIDKAFPGAQWLGVLISLSALLALLTTCLLYTSQSGELFQLTVFLEEKEEAYE